MISKRMIEMLADMKPENAAKNLELLPNEDCVSALLGLEKPGSYEKAARVMEKLTLAKAAEIIGKMATKEAGFIMVNMTVKSVYDIAQKIKEINGTPTTDFPGSDFLAEILEEDAKQHSGRGQE